MNTDERSVQLAALIYAALQRSLSLYKATEGIIHAIEYDGQRRLTLQLDNGQRFLITIQPEGIKQ
jgi:YD repeat-containing protein